MSRSTDDFQSLLNDAFRFLSFRPRSKEEVALYLQKRAKKKNIALEVAGQVLSRLEEMEYVNDQKFALEWVESRSRSKGFGPTRLRQELKRKGIAAEIVENVMRSSSAADADSQYVLAKQSVEKRALKWRQLPPLTCKRKVYDFLLRRGFPSPLALRLVDEYCVKTYNTGCENND